MADDSSGIYTDCRRAKHGLIASVQAVCKEGNSNPIAAWSASMPYIPTIMIKACVKRMQAKHNRSIPMADLLHVSDEGARVVLKTATCCDCS